jgi:PEGA domain
MAALLGGLVAFGSVPVPAYAQKPAPKAAPKPPAAKAPAAKKKGAKPDSEEAKRLEARKNYEDGEAKFGAGDFAGAFAAYKAANDLIPAPQTLYKMALALDKAGKTDEASAAYQTFLDSSPPASMDARVTDSKIRLLELKKSAQASVKVKTDPAGALVTIDGEPQMGMTPMTVKLSVGKHKVHISSPGYETVDREIDVTAAGEPIDLVLVKAANVASTPPPGSAASASASATLPALPPESPPERRSPTAGYILLGVGVAGAAVGTVFGIKALQAKSDFENGEKTDDKADSVDKNALIADMAFGAAFTLGVTGTVLLLTSSGSRSEKAMEAPPSTALHVTPVVTPRAAGAAATLRF